MIFGFSVTVVLRGLDRWPVITVRRAPTTGLPCPLCDAGWIPAHHTHPTEAVR